MEGRGLEKRNGVRDSRNRGQQGQGLGDSRNAVRDSRDGVRVQCLWSMFV